MDRYIPTGNEMVSLPKLNELTAGIEDFTYLSMQHKGLVEVRGGKDLPAKASESWGSAVITEPVSVSAIHAWRKENPEAFIAAFA